jgi:hypothetical protein
MQEKTFYFVRVGGRVVKSTAALVLRNSGTFVFSIAREDVITAIVGEVSGE